MAFVSVERCPWGVGGTGFSVGRDVPGGWEGRRMGCIRWRMRWADCPCRGGRAVGCGASSGGCGRHPRGCGGSAGPGGWQGRARGWAARPCRVAGAGRGPQLVGWGVGVAAFLRRLLAAAMRGPRKAIRWLGLQGFRAGFAPVHAVTLCRLLRRRWRGWLAFCVWGSFRHGGRAFFWR